jgi:hypothetical protein
MLIASLVPVLVAQWRAENETNEKDDRSFEAVCLFSLLGLALTLAFCGLLPA